MVRSIEVPAGTRTRVFRRRFSSLPLTAHLQVNSVSGGDPSGTLERVGSCWIFGRTRSTMPLEPTVRVSKGFWDTFFDVYVIPNEPVSVSVRGPTMSQKRWVLGAAALIVIAAAAVAAFALLG